MYTYYTIIVVFEVGQYDDLATREVQYLLSPIGEVNIVLFVLNLLIAQYTRAENGACMAFFMLVQYMA